MYSALCCRVRSPYAPRSAPRMLHPLLVTSIHPALETAADADAGSARTTSVFLASLYFKPPHLILRFLAPV